MGKRAEEEEGEDKREKARAKAKTPKRGSWLPNSRRSLAATVAEAEEPVPKPDKGLEKRMQKLRPQSFGFRISGELLQSKLYSSVPARGILAKTSP